jgi:hypothetical protein
MRPAAWLFLGTGTAVLLWSAREAAVKRRARQIVSGPTITDSSSVASAIVRSWSKLRGDVPHTVEDWLFPLALSSSETSGWTRMTGYNVGNVPAGQFGSLDEGALYMLRELLQYGGLDAADTNNLPAFQAAATAYLGHQCADLSGLVRRLRGTIVG